MTTPTPPASSAAAHNRMKATRRSGTDAEERLASAMRERSIAFEANVKVLDDHRFVADFVIRNTKVAIFVDGCFWHGCPVHGTRSKSNSKFWDEKILSNKLRDQRAVEILQSQGWIPIRVWEHEDPTEVAARLQGLVDQSATGSMRQAPTEKLSTEPTQ